MRCKNGTSENSLQSKTQSLTWKRSLSVCLCLYDLIRKLKPFSDFREMPFKFLKKSLAMCEFHGIQLSGNYNLLRP